MGIQRKLYQYLVSQGVLALPGMGTLRLQRKPCQLDIADKSIQPPVYFFQWAEEEIHSPKPLFDWLSKTLGIDEDQAISELNDFANHLKEGLQQSRKSNWEEVGSFEKDYQGKIIFHSREWVPLGMMPVKAERVIHEKPSHTMLVGDSERSVEEMTAWESEEVKKDQGWLAALIILILAVLYLGYYFSQHGFQFGNQTGI